MITVLNVESEMFSPLVNSVLRELKERRKTLATAESCTGGLVSALLTHVPGSSVVFQGGIIAYANEAKINLLGVPSDVIQRAGAVSREVAEAMALGARRVLTVDYAIAITGVAGPDGGTPTKPVGTVWTALAAARGVAAELLQLGGGRAAIRAAAARFVLENLLKAVQA